MEISYDKEADAIYIKFKKGDFSRNKKIDEHTIIDYDEAGGVLGIEMLRVSKRFPDFSKVQLKNLALAK